MAEEEEYVHKDLAVKGMGIRQGFSQPLTLRSPVTDLPQPAPRAYMTVSLVY